MSSVKAECCRTILFCAAPGCSTTLAWPRNQGRATSDSAGWFVIRPTATRVSCRRLTGLERLTERDHAVCGHGCAHVLIARFLYAAVNRSSATTDQICPRTETLGRLRSANARDDRQAISPRSPQGSVMAPQPRPPSLRKRRS